MPVEADGTYRSLYLEMDLVPLRHSINFFTKRKTRERHNLQVLERVLQQFNPDVIFIWGMWNLPYSLAALAEARQPHTVVYRFATYWPTLPSQHAFYWRTPGRNWYSRLPKQLLGHVALAMLTREAERTPLAFRHAICVSAASRKVLVEAGVPVSHARVIHTGLNVSDYLKGGEQHLPHHDAQNLNLLYAGRISPEKGIDTLILAMSRLVCREGRRDIKLTLAGSGSVDYENYLRQLVNQSGLADNVSFLGWVSPVEMPELLPQFNVLVVPSIWPEPFARVLLEGMISGLVVVATPTGGTTEILRDGDNGLLFAAGDAEHLAQKILGLTADPQLRHRLALAGRQTVVERFTNTKMMDEIEGYLEEVVQSSTHESADQFESK
jgi:glycosyltransferase involved in cell wall biosynthesis